MSRFDAGERQGGRRIAVVDLRSWAEDPRTFGAQDEGGVESLYFIQGRSLSQDSMLQQTVDRWSWEIEKKADVGACEGRSIFWLVAQICSSRNSFSLTRTTTPSGWTIRRGVAIQSGPILIRLDRCEP